MAENLSIEQKQNYHDHYLVHFLAFEDISKEVAANSLF